MISDLCTNFPALAVDTSSMRSSIAVRDGAGRVHEWVSSGDSASHNEELSSEISALVKNSGVVLSDLSTLIVGIGPGSFTGLRIGLSVLKGLAVGLKTPLVSYSSLMAIGNEARETGSLIVAISDARRGEVFTLFMQKGGDGKLQVLEPASILTPQKVLDGAHFYAQKEGIPVGDIVVAYADPIATLEYGGELAVLRSHRSEHLGRSLLELDSPQIREFSLSNIAKIEPEYLRAVAAKTIAERANIALDTL